MTISNDRLVDLTVKVFADDLADAVRGESGHLINRDGKYEELELVRIEQYFSSHLYVFSGIRKKTFTLEKYSKEDQAVWIDFKSNESFTNGDTLNADFLQEVFPNQINMLKLRINNNQSFYQLKQENSKIALLD